MQSAMLLLPNELILEITSYQHLADIKNLRLVCKRLSGIVEPLLWETLVLDFRNSVSMPPSVASNRGYMGHYIGLSQRAKSSRQVRVSQYNYVEFEQLAMNASNAHKFANVLRLELVGGLSMPLRTFEFGSTGSIQKKEIDCEQLDTFLGAILSSRLTRLAELTIDFAGDVLVTKYKGLEKLLKRFNGVVKSAHVHWLVEPPSGIVLAGPIKHLSFTLAGMYSIEKIPSTVEHLTVYAIRGGVGPASTAKTSDMSKLLKGAECLTHLTLERMSIDQDEAGWLPQTVHTMEVDLVAITGVEGMAVSGLNAIFPQVKSLILCIVSTSPPALFNCMQFPGVDFLSVTFRGQGYEFEVPPWLRPTVLQVHGVSINDWGSIGRKFHNLDHFVVSFSCSCGVCLQRGLADVNPGLLTQRLDMHILELISRSLDGFYVARLTIDLGFADSPDIGMVSRTLRKSCKELYLYDVPYRLSRGDLMKPALRDFKFEKSSYILERVDLDFVYKEVYRQDVCTVKGYRVKADI